MIACSWPRRMAATGACAEQDHVQNIIRRSVSVIGRRVDAASS